ncbi:MAG: hypothetical protein KGJ37_07175 [Verrucomicrobiota bacterium]|nr:hypothetical protein [Verrucomicrobiota bacterium]
MASHPSQEKAAEASTSAVKSKPIVQASVPPPPSTPGKEHPATPYKAAVNKTEAVIAAHTGASSKQVAKVLDETKPAPAPEVKPAASAPAPQGKPVVAFNLPAAKSEPQLPAAKTQPPTPPPAPQTVHIELSPVEQASPAFRAFIVNTHVNGVFQGNPPRALINGRTVTVGEIVDPQLGITFAGIDVQQKRIFLKDPNGTTLAKEY